MCVISLLVKWTILMASLLSVKALEVGTSDSDAPISFTASTALQCESTKNGSSCDDGAEVPQSAVDTIAHSPMQEIPRELRNVLLYAQNLVHERSRKPQGQEKNTEIRRNLMSTESEVASPGCGEFYGLGEQGCVADCLRQEECTPVELQFYDSMYGEIVEPFANMTVFQTLIEDLSLGFLPAGVSVVGGQIQNEDYGTPFIRLGPEEPFKILYQAEEPLFPYGSYVEYTLLINLIAEKFPPLENFLNVQILGSPNTHIKSTSAIIEPIFFMEGLENIRITLSFESENGNDFAFEVIPIEAIQRPLGIMSFHLQATVRNYAPEVISRVSYTENSTVVISTTGIDKECEETQVFISRLPLHGSLYECECSLLWAMPIQAEQLPYAVNNSCGQIVYKPFSNVALDGEAQFDYIDVFAMDEHGLQSNVTSIEFEALQPPEVSLSVLTENDQSPYVCHFSSSQGNASFVNQVMRISSNQSIAINSSFVFEIRFLAALEMNFGIQEGSLYLVNVPEMDFSIGWESPFSPLSCWFGESVVHSSHLLDNTWHHYLCSWNESTYRLQLEIDGIVVGEAVTKTYMPKRLSHVDVGGGTIGISGWLSSIRLSENLGQIGQSGFIDYCADCSTRAHTVFQLCFNQLSSPVVMDDCGSKFSGTLGIIDKDERFIASSTDGPQVVLSPQPSKSIVELTEDSVVMFSLAPNEEGLGSTQIQLIVKPLAGKIITAENIVLEEGQIINDDSPLWFMPSETGTNPTSGTVTDLAKFRVFQNGPIEEIETIEFSIVPVDDVPVATSIESLSLTPNSVNIVVLGGVDVDGDELYVIITHLFSSIGVNFLNNDGTVGEQVNVAEPFPSKAALAFVVPRNVPDNETLRFAVLDGKYTSEEAYVSINPSSEDLIGPVIGPEGLSVHFKFSTGLNLGKLSKYRAHSRSFSVDFLMKSFDNIQESEIFFAASPKVNISLSRDSIGFLSFGTKIGDLEEEKKIDKSIGIGTWISVAIGLDENGVCLIIDGELMSCLLEKQKYHLWEQEIQEIEVVIGGYFGGEIDDLRIWSSGNDDLKEVAMRSYYSNRSLLGKMLAFFDMNSDLPFLVEDKDRNLTIVLEGDDNVIAPTLRDSSPRRHLDPAKYDVIAGRTISIPLEWTDITGEELYIEFFDVPEIGNLSMIDDDNLTVWISADTIIRGRTKAVQYHAPITSVPKGSSMNISFSYDVEFASTAELGGFYNPSHRRLNVYNETRITLHSSNINSAPIITTAVHEIELNCSKRFARFKISAKDIDVHDSLALVVVQTTKQGEIRLLNGSVVAVGDIVLMPRAVNLTSEIYLQYYPGDINSDQNIEALFKYYVIDGEAATFIKTIRFWGDQCARPSIGPAGLALEFLGLNESSIVFYMESASQGPITLGLYLRIVDSYSLGQLSAAIAQVGPFTVELDTFYSIRIFEFGVEKAVQSSEKSIDIRDGQWHFLAIEVSDQEFLVVIDAVDKYQAFYDGNTVVFESVRIGTNSYGVGSFVGYVDEISVWEGQYSALASAIQFVSNTRLSPSLPGLRQYFQCNEAAGNILYSSISNDTAEVEEYDALENNIRRVSSTAPVYLVEPQEVNQTLHFEVEILAFYVLGTSISILINALPEHGTLIDNATQTILSNEVLYDLSTTTIVYVPDLGYKGNDSFTYGLADSQMSDRRSTTGFACNMTVSARDPDPFAPTAASGNFTFNGNIDQFQPLNGFLNLTVAGSGELEFVISRVPQFGTLKGPGGVIRPGAVLNVSEVQSLEYKPRINDESANVDGFRYYVRNSLGSNGGGLRSQSSTITLRYDGQYDTVPAVGIGGLMLDISNAQNDFPAVSFGPLGSLESISNSSNYKLRFRFWVRMSSACPSGVILFKASSLEMIYKDSFLVISDSNYSISTQTNVSDNTWHIMGFSMVDSLIESIFLDSNEITPDNPESRLYVNFTAELQLAIKFEGQMDSFVLEDLTHSTEVFAFEANEAEGPLLIDRKGNHYGNISTVVNVVKRKSTTAPIENPYLSVHYLAPLMVKLFAYAEAPVPGLTFNLTTLPTKGSLYYNGVGILEVPFSLTGNEVTYIPARNAGNYTTSFQYTARAGDSNLFSDSISQTIVVLEPDFAPSSVNYYRELEIGFSDTLEINLLEDIFVQSSRVVVNISSIPPFGELSILPKYKVLSAGSSIEVENDAGALVQYSPQANAAGQFFLGYTISDGLTISNEYVIAIKVRENVALRLNRNDLQTKLFSLWSSYDGLSMDIWLEPSNPRNVTSNFIFHIANSMRLCPVQSHGDVIVEETWNHVAVTKTNSDIGTLYLNGMAFAKGYCSSEVDAVLSSFLRRIEEDVLIGSVKLFKGVSEAKDIWNRWFGGREQSIPYENGIIKSWEFVNRENIPLGSTFSHESQRTRLHFPQDLQGIDLVPYSLPILVHETDKPIGNDLVAGDRALWLSGRGDGLNTTLYLPMDIERPVEGLRINFFMKPLFTVFLSNVNIVTAGPLAVGIEARGLYVSFNGIIASSEVKLKGGGWCKIHAEISLGKVKLFLNDDMIAQMNISPTQVYETVSASSPLTTVIGASLYRGAVDNLKISFESFTPSLESVVETEILSLSFEENFDSVVPSLSKIGFPLLVQSDAQNYRNLSAGVMSVVEGQFTNVSIPVTGVLSNKLLITLLSVPDLNVSGCQVFAPDNEYQLSPVSSDILPLALPFSNLTVHCDRRYRAEQYSITVSVSDGSFLIDSFPIELRVLRSRPILLGSDINLFVSSNTSTKLDIGLSLGKESTEMDEDPEVIIIALPMQGDLAVGNRVLLYPYEIVEYDWQGNLETLQYAPQLNVSSGEDEIRFAIRQGSKVVDTFSAFLKIQSQYDAYDIDSMANLTLAGAAALFTSINSEISLIYSEAITNVSLILHFNSLSSFETTTPLIGMEVSSREPNSTISESINFAVTFNSLGQPALSATANQSLEVQLVSTGDSSKVKGGFNDGNWHRIAVTVAFVVEPFRILASAWFSIDGDLIASPKYQIVKPNSVSTFLDEVKLETVTLGGGYIGLVDETMVFINASSSFLAPAQTIIDPLSPFLAKYLSFDCSLVKDDVSNSLIEGVDIDFRNSSLPIISKQIIANEGANLSFHLGNCEILEYYELLSLPTRGHLIAQSGQRIVSLSDNKSVGPYFTYESPDGVQDTESDGLTYSVNGQRFDVEILVTPVNHSPVFKEIIQRESGSKIELEITFEDLDLQFVSRSETLTLNFDSVPLFGILKFNSSMVGYGTKIKLPYGPQNGKSFVTFTLTYTVDGSLNSTAYAGGLNLSDIYASETFQVTASDSNGLLSTSPLIYISPDYLPFHIVEENFNSSCIEWSILDTNIGGFAAVFLADTEPLEISIESNTTVLKEFAVDFQVKWNASSNVPPNKQYIALADSLFEIQLGPAGELIVSISSSGIMVPVPCFITCSIKDGLQHHVAIGYNIIGGIFFIILDGELVGQNVLGSGVSLAVTLPQMVRIGANFTGIIDEFRLNSQYDAGVFQRVELIQTDNLLILEHFDSLSRLWTQGLGFVSSPFTYKGTTTMSLTLEGMSITSDMLMEITDSFQEEKLYITKVPTSSIVHSANGTQISKVPYGPIDLSSGHVVSISGLQMSLGGPKENKLSFAVNSTCSDGQVFVLRSFQFDGMTTSEEVVPQSNNPETSTPAASAVFSSLSAESASAATMIHRTAVRFDGIDDCLLVSSQTEPETNEFTIEFWLKPDNGNNSVQVLFHSDILVLQDENTTGVVVELKNLERTGLLAGIPVEPSERRIETTKKLRVLEWNSVAVEVVKGLEPTVNVYIDGVLVSEWMGFGFQLSGNLGDVAFGCQRPMASNLSYAGALDEVRIWSRRVPTQFLGLADGTVIEQEDLHQGLWAKYSFDNTTLLADIGVAVDDGSVSLSHHGTITGNVSLVESNLPTIYFPRLFISKGDTANYTLDLNFTAVSLMPSSVFISRLPIQGQLYASYNGPLIRSTPYKVNQSIFGNYPVAYEAHSTANSTDLFIFAFGIFFNESQALELDIPVYIKILEAIDEVIDAGESSILPEPVGAQNDCSSLPIAINASDADQAFITTIASNLSMSEQLIITRIPTLLGVREASNGSLINGIPYVISPEESDVDIIFSDFKGSGSDILQFTVLDSSGNVKSSECITLDLSMEGSKPPSLKTPTTYSVGYNEMKFIRILALSAGISSEPITISIASVPANGVLYISGPESQIDLLVNSVPINVSSDGTLSMGYDPPVNAESAESFGDILDTFDINISSEFSSTAYTISFFLDNSNTTGTLDATMAPGIAGPAGFEARFDADNSGFIVELSPAESNAIEAMTSFTVESWFRLPLGSFAPFACIISQGVFFPPPPLTSNSAPFALQWHETLGLGFHVTTSMLDRVSIYSGQNYDDGIWHFVVGTFDFNSGIMRLFIDGILVAEGNTGAEVATLGSTSPVMIGSNAVDSTPTYPGSIDHVRLLLQPLVANQISSRYLSYEVIETRNEVSFVDTLSFAPLSIGFEVDFNQLSVNSGVSLFPSTAPLKQVAVAEFDDASRSFIAEITLQVTDLDSILVIYSLPDRGSLLIFSENGTHIPILSSSFKFSASTYGNRLLYLLDSEDAKGGGNVTYTAALPNDTMISYYATVDRGQSEAADEPSQDLPSKMITVHIRHFKEFEAPTCEGIDLTGLEGETIQIHPVFADPQQLPVTINIVNLGSTNGVIQEGESSGTETDTLMYVPEPHFHSPPDAILAYEVVNDVGLSSGLCPIRIRLEAVNSMPRAILPVFYAMYGNATMVSVGLLLSVEDADVGEDPMGFLSVSLSVEKGLLVSNSFSPNGAKALVIEGPLGYVNAELKAVVYLGTEGIEDDLSLEVNDNGFTGLGGALSDKESTHIFHCTSYVARASSTVLVISFDCSVGVGLVNSNIPCSSVLPESVVQLLGTSPSCSFISLTVFVAELDSDQQLLPPTPTIEIPELIDLNIEGLFPSLFVDPTIGLVIPGLDQRTQELIERSIAVLNVPTQYGRCSDVVLDGSFSVGGFNDAVLEYFFRLFDINVTGTEAEIASLRQAQGLVERTRDQPIITIEAGILPPGDYVVQLQINNAFGFPSEVVTAAFSQLEVILPAVAIQLPNNNQSYPQGAQILIPAVVTPTPAADCSPSNESLTAFTFLWTAAFTPPGSTVQEEFSLTNAGIDDDSKDLFIPGGSLPVGSWRVTLTATQTSQQPPVSNFDVYFFRITPVPVVAYVEGGFMRTWPAGAMLILDASRSVNPANPNEDLQFSWACTTQGTNSPCPFNQALEEANFSTVTLATDVSQANSTVTIVVTVRNSEGSTDFFPVHVALVEAPPNPTAGEIALASFILPSHVTYTSAGTTLEAEISLGNEPLQYSWVLRGEAVTSCRITLQPHCFTAGSTAQLNFTNVNDFPNGVESARFTIGAGVLEFGRYIVELYLDGSFNAAYELLVTPTLQAFVTVVPTSGIEQETIFRVSSNFVNIDIASDISMLSQLVSKSEDGSVIALSGIDPITVYNIKLSSGTSEVGVRVFDSLNLQLAGEGFTNVEVSSLVVEGLTDEQRLDILLSLMNEAVAEVIELLELEDFDAALARISSITQTFASFDEELIENLDEVIPNEAEREQFISEISNAIAFLSQSVRDTAVAISDSGQLGMTDLILGAAETISQIGPMAAVFFRDDTVGFLIEVVELVAGGNDLTLQQVSLSLDNAQSIQNLFSNLISAQMRSDARFSLSSEQVNTLVTVMQNALAAAVANSASEGQVATSITSPNIRQTTLRVPKGILAQFQVLLAEASISPILVSGEGDILLVLTEFFDSSLFDVDSEPDSVIQTLAAYDLESPSSRRRSLMASTNNVQLGATLRLQTAAGNFVDGTTVICQQANDNNQFFNFAVATNVQVVGDQVFANCRGGSFGFFRIDIGILDEPFPPSPPPPPPPLPPGFSNPPAPGIDNAPPGDVIRSPPVQPFPPPNDGSSGGGGGGGSDSTVIILAIVFSILGAILLGVLIFYGARRVQERKFESMYKAAAQGESLDTQEFYGAGPDGQPTSFISMPVAGSMRTRANVTDDSILAGFGDIVSGRSKPGQHAQDAGNPSTQSRDEPATAP